MHEDWPASSWYSPSGHAVQIESPVAEYVPAPQRAHVAAPFELAMRPASHLTQVLLASSANVPLEQFTQDDPGFEKVPARHALQLAWPECEK